MKFKQMKKIAFIVSGFLLISCKGLHDKDRLTSDKFNHLLSTVAKGWEEGDSRMAADCFAEDAIYIEPPNQQLYRGRNELFEFFGGEEGRSDPMNMTWHNIVFNEEDQVGMGEYTFGYRGRLTHGIVIVKVSAGKIWRWREYQYRTEMEWTDFVGESVF